MSEAGPRLNGPASPTGKYIDGIDPDDPAYIKNLQRPAEVKEDLQQMENRSRVSLVLNSQAFKDELEQVVEEQLRNGPYPASLIALQQITDLLLPHSKGSLGSLARGATAIPINDLRGVESLGFAKGEKLLRCKLAALYRIIDLCGWSHGIYNHISARISPDHEHFLLNPFGMLYSEITASSLIKVDVRGDIVEPGSTQLGVNKAGFTLHSAIHQARPDIKCVVHLHTPAAVAVSAMKCGLLPMSQEALICGKLSYHDYQGIFIDPEEREKLARNLGVHNKILILRNHGVVACGETIEEAFHFTFNLMAACEAQVKAVPAGLDNIVIPSEEAREQVYRTANQGGGGVESTGRKWKIGELEFEALMRTLDNSGFRTGYVYKLPFVKQEKKDRSNSEVEIPPASSSFTYVFDGDYEHSKYASPIKAAMERQKKAFKAGWLTTPNAYKKTEVEEIGTTTPKKITKWVPESDSANRPSGTPIKLENPNQFAPQGENPKEFKQKQKSIKKDYYEEKVTAGPQSKILEGISWDEAQRAKDGMLSGAGDQLIVVGAASKGIIQRDHQHNAVVYRQYYAANPFESMSEAEIEQYQAEVQRREKGEPVQETVSEPSNVVLKLQQPPQIEQVHQPEPPHETQRIPETQKATEATKSSPPVEESSKISRSTPEPQQPREDKAINELADTVVQTVISDALSVLRRGKGQQILTGTEPLHQNSNFSQHSMGSQIINAKKTSSTTNYQDKYCNDIFFRDTMKQSHRLGQCGTHSLEDKDKSKTELREDAAGAATEDLRWCASGASNADDGDYVTVQLQPVQLYHGQTSEGTMRVRFTIQSTVRRHFRADYERGGIIDGVDASVSEPIVEMTGSSSQNEHCDGQNVSVNQVRVRKESQHNRMSFAKETTNTAGVSSTTCTEVSHSSISETVASNDGLKEETVDKDIFSSNTQSQPDTKCVLTKNIEECKLLYADDEVEENISLKKQILSEFKKSHDTTKGLNFDCKNENLLFSDISAKKKENINFDKVDDSFEKILLSPENIFDKSKSNEGLNLLDFIGAAPLDSFEEIEDVCASSLAIPNVKTVTCCEENKVITSQLTFDKADDYISQSNVVPKQNILSSVESFSTATATDLATSLLDVLGSDRKELQIKEHDVIEETIEMNLTKDACFVNNLESENVRSDNAIVDTMEHQNVKKTHLETDFITPKMEEDLDTMKAMSTDGTLSEQCKGRKETCIDEVLPPLSVNEKENISDEQNEKQIYSKQLTHLDEGPLQTSSPKLGRSKSKDSPFKTYPKKLGKSEETLLDIMPLKCQKIKGVAKSQEELEDSENTENHKELLSRTVSLGPHHKKKRHRNTTIKRNAISKETVIDDNPVAGIADKGNLSPTKFALDRYNLMIHNEIMKLSNYASYFKPPDIIAYPLSSSTMPPLPDTTEVPSVSDTERSHRRMDRSGNLRSDYNAPQPYNNPPRPINPPPKREKARHHSEDVQDQEENVPKRRWTPKQKRDRRIVSEEVDEKNTEKKKSTEEAYRPEVYRSSSSSIKESHHSGQDERKVHDESVRGNRSSKNETQDRTRPEYKKDRRTERQGSIDSYVRPLEQKDETARKRSTKSENRDDRKEMGRREESMEEEMIRKPSSEEKGKVFVKSRENYDVVVEQNRPQSKDMSKDKRAVQVLPINTNVQPKIDNEGEIKRRSASDKEKRGPMLTEQLTRETDLDDYLLKQQEEKLSRETDLCEQPSQRNNDTIKPKDINRQESENLKKNHKETFIDDQVNEVQFRRKDGEEKETVKKGHYRSKKEDDEEGRDKRKSSDRSRRNDREKREDEKLEEDRDQRRSYDRGRRNNREEKGEEKLEEDRDTRKSYGRSGRVEKDDEDRLEEDRDHKRNYDRARKVDKDDEDRLEEDRDHRRSYDRAKKNNRDIKDDVKLKEDKDPRQSSDRPRRNRGDKDEERSEVDRDKRRSYDKPRRNRGDQDEERLEVDRDQRRSYDSARKSNRDDKDEERLEVDRDQRRSYDSARKSNRDDQDEERLEVGRDQRRSYESARKSNRDDKDEERLEVDRDQRRSYGSARKSNRDDKNEEKLEVDRDQRSYGRVKRNERNDNNEEDQDQRRNSDRARKKDGDMKDEKLDEDPDLRRNYDRVKRNRDDENRLQIDRDKKSSDRARKNDKIPEEDYDKRKSYERTRKNDDINIPDESSKKLHELKKTDEIRRNDNADKLNNFEDHRLGNIKDENDNEKRRHYERGRKSGAEGVIHDTVPNVILKEDVQREPTNKGKFENKLKNKLKEKEVDLKDNSSSKRNSSRQDRGSREKEDKYLDKIKTEPIKSSVHPKNTLTADSDEDAPPVPPRFVSLEADDILHKQSDRIIDNGAKRPDSKPRKSGHGKHIDSEDFPHETNGRDRDIKLSIDSDQNKFEKRPSDKTKERPPEPRKRRSYVIEDESDKYIKSRDDLQKPENFKVLLPVETSKDLKVEKREHKELEPYMYARGRRSGRIPKRLDISREDAADSESDNQLDDLDKFMPDNPIELHIDDTKDDTNETYQEEETPTKKSTGIFNLFSCVGGKSSDILKKKTKDKKPVKKYYDEGEKRKIKKLAKEKEKEEKNKLYFQDLEEATVENDSILAAPENEKKPLNEVESSDIVVADPCVPEADLRLSGRRYQKKQKSSEMSKPLSTFIDPIAVFEDVLGTNDEFEEVDDLPLGTFTRWKEDKVEEPKLSSFMSAKREEKLNTYRSFGRRSYAQSMEDSPKKTSDSVDSDFNQDVKEESGDVSATSRSSSSFLKMSSTSEEPVKLKGGCPDMQYYHDDSLDSDFESYEQSNLKTKSSFQNIVQSKDMSESNFKNDVHLKDMSESNFQNIVQNKDLTEPNFQNNVHNQDMSESNFLNDVQTNLVFQTNNFNKDIEPNAFGEADTVDKKSLAPDLNEKIIDEKDKCLLHMEPLSMNQNVLSSPFSLHSVEIRLEPPTPESTLENSLEHSIEVCDSEKIEVDHCDNSLNPVGQDSSAHDDDHVLNISAPAFLDVSHDLNNSFDPSASFEADMMYRRKHRTVSFDERLTAECNLSPSLFRKNPSSLIAEPVTRPRSSSTTSNPLTYEPWRAKAYKQQHHHRSFSASGMLHGRSASRLHKSHSIGEIYNSTVASSVARRRAKTIVSSDITPRMYQPRQRIRSRALLGDASFGSVAPIRQRSFSGFDYATSSGSVEPTSVTVKRSESERQTSKIQMLEKEETKNVERSKSDRRQKHKEHGDAKPASPSKSDTLKSTDSASGGETLEDRSSKEGSPTKEHPSPTKEKKKKKKFRIPSFSKKKSKEHKESAM